jgi:transcriptional regulator with XRE-family HTH domain
LKNSIYKKQRCDEELLLKIVLHIKQLRKEKKVSQMEFYYDTNIHIGRIESKRVNVSVSVLYDICTYFGISLEEFFLKV